MIEKVVGLTEKEIALKLDRVIDKKLSTIVSLTAATKTVSPLENGTTFTVDVDGLAVTLPTGVAGLKYKFIISTPQTSSNVFTIAPAAAGVLFTGIAKVGLASTSVASWFKPNGTTMNLMTMTATTTGGLTGGFVELICVSATEWSVFAELLGTTPVATPFSAV